MKSVYSAVRSGALNKAVCASALRVNRKLQSRLKHRPALWDVNGEKKSKSGGGLFEVDSSLGINNFSYIHSFTSSAEHR